jgi:hypothetical protein
MGHVPQVPNTASETKTRAVLIEIALDDMLNELVKSGFKESANPLLLNV